MAEFNVIEVMIRSVASVGLSFIATRFMGHTPLHRFDAITNIVIGVLAAMMAVIPSLPWLWPTIAIAIYTAVHAGLSALVYRSAYLRSWIAGKAKVVMNDGLFYRANMRRANMDIDEFQMLCRRAGYFTLDDVQTVVLERNGTVSILPKAHARSVTPRDFDLPSLQTHMITTIIVNGHLIRDHLIRAGKSEHWLHKQLEERGISRIQEVFLATLTRTNELSVYGQTDSSGNFTF